MHYAHPALGSLAKTDLAILVVGEVGTRPDDTARRIHELSGRAAGSELRASEMAAGALEGQMRKLGDGTLLLLDVDALVPSDQALLLHALEAPEAIGHSAFGARARVIATTERDLRGRVGQGSFLSDLYFRLAGLTVRVGALREHPKLRSVILEALDDAATAADVDLPELDDHAIAELERYPWPGNLDELQGVAAEIVESGGRWDRDAVAALLEDSDVDVDTSEPRTLASIVDDAIAAALDQCGGDVKRAAKTLGVSRATVYRRTRTDRGRQSA